MRHRHSKHCDVIRCPILRRSPGPRLETVPSHPAYINQYMLWEHFSSILFRIQLDTPLGEYLNNPPLLQCRAFPLLLLQVPFNLGELDLSSASQLPSFPRTVRTFLEFTADAVSASPTLHQPTNLNNVFQRTLQGQRSSTCSMFLSPSSHPFLSQPRCLVLDSPFPPFTFPLVRNHDSLNAFTDLRPTLSSVKLRSLSVPVLRPPTKLLAVLPSRPASPPLERSNTPKARLRSRPPRLRATLRGK